MIHEITRNLLSQLVIDQTKPLLICDVDEVVVHFTQELEMYLLDQDLVLDTSTYALSGNIKSIANNTALSNEHVSQLITDFFRERTKFMTPIEGAVDALQKMGSLANVVMLTNLPHEQGEDRAHNLRELGLEFPVVTNSGPKGPAISHLAGLVQAPVVFVDDSPGFIASAQAHAPDVHLVHFVQDKRFDHLIERFPYVSLRTHHWDEALPHIIDIFATK